MCVRNKTCCGFVMRKFKLNIVDAWIIQSKHAMEHKSLKDNYSLNFKSMSKTISPFMIILTMTHMMEFVSSVASVFVTWDVIWILVTMTFFSNLHMVREYIYVYTNLWDGRVPMLMDLECSGTLRFFNVSSFLVEACWKVETASTVLSYPQFNRTRVILLKLVVW